MMEICFNACNKYRKSKNLKILYIFSKALGLSIVSGGCGHEYKEIF